MAGKKKVDDNAEEKEVQVKLVKMARPDGQTADVHPDEVENYRKGNYQVVQ